MSLSTDWEVKNIYKYADLLKKEYELKEKLSNIHDELINLSINMSNEDINEANELFEKIMREEREPDEQ